MTDEQAIKLAKNYYHNTGRPIVRIPWTGVINEIVTVDLRDFSNPIVTRKAPDPIND